MRIEKSVLLEGISQNERTSESARQTTTSVKTESAVSVSKNLLVEPGSYQKPVSSGTQSEEIQNFFSRQSDEVNNAQNQMVILSNTMSDQDYQELAENGFQAEDMDSRTIVTVVDKIKIQLAKAGVDISGMGDALTEDQIEAAGESQAVAVSLVKSFEQADLPVTEDNLSEGMEAVSRASQITSLSDGAVKYMLDNQLDPTIENLYKAEFSGSTSGMSQTGQKIDLSGMQEQIKSVIQESGNEVNADTVQAGSWMIQNQIPLTTGNFAQYQQLKNTSFPLDTTQITDAVASAVAEGRRPQDAMLLSGYSLSDQAEETIGRLNEISQEAVEQVVSSGTTISIQNLSEAQKKIMSLQADDSSKDQTQEDQLSQEVSSEGQATQTPDHSLRLISAQRQLEEARLLLTKQSCVAMMKQGIQVDTTSLETLVDQLKQKEADYYQSLLGQTGSEEVTDSQVTSLASATKTISELKDLPAYALGGRQIQTETVQSLYTAASGLKQTMTQAEDAYDTMMTTVRKDLGDNIQKAFSNVSDILSDLGLEDTSSNSRAVRILAYNQLPITSDSINEMKEADSLVQRTFSNLTPAAVSTMIRQGKNPLETPLAQLNAQAEAIRSEQGASEERYSEYLWKMDQKSEMSQEERESYIGIYRLMNQVDQTDGAAIGALVNQGNELTMKNLLTAVRSSKKSGMDYKVSDDVGSVTSVKDSNTSITEQIQSAFQINCVKQMAEIATPDAISNLTSTPDWENQTPEQTYEQMREYLYDSGDQEEDQTKAYQKFNATQIRQAAVSDAQVYSMLNQYQIPVTAANLMAASGMINNRNQVFSLLFNSDEVFDGEAVDFGAVQDEIIQRFADALESPTELAEAQKTLADVAENVMKTMITDSDHVSSVNIRELKTLNAQVSMMQKMGEEENYAIPVLVGDEVTNVSLKIVRGTEKKGMVDILFESELTGKISARIQAEEKSISGVIATDDRQMQQKLEAGFTDGTFSQLLPDKTTQLTTVYSQHLDLKKAYSKSSDRTEKKADSTSETQKQAENSEVETSELYALAKSFLTAVKKAAVSSDITTI